MIAPFDNPPILRRDSFERSIYLGLESVLRLAGMTWPACLKGGPSSLNHLYGAFEIASSSIPYFALRRD